jgi:hypothetical protein
MLFDGDIARLCHKVSFHDRASDSRMHADLLSDCWGSDAPRAYSRNARSQTLVYLSL